MSKSKSRLFADKASSVFGTSAFLNVENLPVSAAMQTAIDSIDALPNQENNSGKYLTTDGANPSWDSLDTDANSTTKSLYEMSGIIANDYTIASGNNAISAGPVVVNSGVVVTVPTGSRWVVV